MIYVMSDLHGCYEKYKKMLEKIKFSEDDTLYILGDVVDRGPDGIKILLDVAKRKNVVLLRGNHDDTALIILQNAVSKKSKFTEEMLGDMIQLWCLDGGRETLGQFLTSTTEEKKTALMTLKMSMIYEELEVNGKKFFLSHTVPEKEKMEQFETCEINDFLWGEPDYELEYFPDKYIVTGHTPTGYIEESSIGKIYRKNHHIAIDCGAVFGNPLGCLCLDTMEEFYV